MALTKVNNRMIDGAVLNVVDYGAVGDGTADDTVAINAALSAVTSGDAVYFPPGNYKITSQITFDKDNVCIFGDGSTQTIITYAGASTTNDIFLMGDGTNEFKNFAFKGLRITSSVTMTGGFTFNFRRMVRSYLYDIILEGQDGNVPPKLYGGLWFNGLDDVQLTQFRFALLNEGIRVNGIAGAGVPKAGLFVNNGKLTGGTIGIRVGGAFGGLYVDMTDVIAMSAAGVKIDTDIVAENNREIFLGQTCVIDSVSAGYGVHVTDALGGGQTLLMAGTWVASASSHGIFLNGATTYVVTMAGCQLFNNGGDGLRVDNTNPIVSISGSTIRNSGGYGINGGVASNNVKISDCQFLSNASGDFADYALTNSAVSQMGHFVKEIKIGETTSTATGRKLTLSTGLNTETSQIENLNAGFSNTLLSLKIGGRGNSTAYDYISAGNTAGGSFRVRGDGTIFADVGTIATPADYAEMFEWADGNPNSEDRTGHTVSLVGNKIKIAETGDTVIGVVSAAPMIVGDGAPFRWANAHLTDDFGRVLLEDYEVVEWIEKDPGEFHVETDSMGKQTIIVDREGGEKNHSYPSNKVPDGITAPVDAAKTILKRQMKNPDWDESVSYTPRQERIEWSAIGLVGKLRVKSGQATNSSWVKMRDISSSIEEWLIK